MRDRGSGLGDTVARSLIENIVEGVYPPESALPSESELSNQHNVSRLTVREAVRILRAKGVLRVVRGRGTYVQPTSLWSPLDPDLLIAQSRGSEAAVESANTLVEARRVIEEGVVDLAAARRSDQDLVELDATLAQMRGSVGEIEAFAEADRAFHQAVMAAAHNPVIAAMFEPLGVIIHQIRRGSSCHPEPRQASIQAHEQIVEAIRARDGDAARNTLRGWLVDTERGLEMLASQETHEHEME